MSDYSKVYDGAAKDTAESVLAGADFDSEFNLIETAVNSKSDKVVSATDHNLLMMDANGNLEDSGIETDGTGAIVNPVLNTSASGTAVLDEDDMASDSATKIATQQSIKAYTDGRFAEKQAMTTLTAASTKTITGLENARRITIHFYNVRPAAANNHLWLRLGTSSGIISTGSYASTYAALNLFGTNAVGGSASETKFWLAYSMDASALVNGTVVLERVGAYWFLSVNIADNGVDEVYWGAGRLVSSDIDRIQVIESSGAAFSAGSVGVNVEY